MTKDDKETIEMLLQGHKINALSRDCIRILDSKGIPIRKVSADLFYAVRPVLRKKKLLFCMDIGKVRSLHGNCLLKRIYKKKDIPFNDAKLLAPPPPYPKASKVPQRSFNLSITN